MALTPDTDEFSQFLRLAFLRSPNFVTGISGWTINQDGSAEFNNVTIRNGTIISGVSLYYSGPPAAGNLVASIAATAGTDTHGNAYLAGITNYVAATPPPTVLAVNLFNGNINFYFAASSAGPFTVQSQVGIGVSTFSGITGTRPGSLIFQSDTNDGVFMAGSNAAATFGEVWYAPSGDTTGATDAARINLFLLNGHSIVHLVKGTYYINAAIVPLTNSSLIGAGAGATVINQVTNAAEGITATNKSTVTLRGFTLVGNGSGTSTAAGIHFSSNPPTANHILDDIIVQNFGLQGFLFDSVFLTELRKCEALANGGNGFQVTNSFAVPTSFSFHTCYANANLGTYGYELDALQYSSLSGCAADNNATGYGLLGCQGVTLTGCGTEAFTATGYLFNNCKGCGLYGGFTFNGKTKVAWVTNGTARQTIGGLTETSPAAGAAACVQTDAGTSSVLWGITKVTADNLAAGTFTNVDGSA